MATRLAPAISPDTEFFWDGLREHKLLIQRCAGCGQLRHPPRPMCPNCRSLDWNTIESSGRGAIYIIGIILQIASHGLGLLVAGRLVAGLGVGFEINPVGRNDRLKPR